MSDFNTEFNSLEEQFNTNYAAGIKGDKGDKGDPGEKGDSVTGATINQNHELILTVGTGTINAGVLPRGETGATGATGAKILSTSLYGTDGDGGNIYKQTFDNGTECFFTAPKGAKGNTGDTGSQGIPGTMGTTFTPSVSNEGVISWSNDGGKPNPSSVNIKGAKGDPGRDGIGIPGRDGRDGLTTSITMNGETYTHVNGNINIGTVITSLAGYATQAWVNAKGYITKAVNDLTYYYTKTDTDTLLAAKADVSAIPTKTSDLTNDGDGTHAFLTEHQSLAAYRTSAAQDVIDSSLQPKTDILLSSLDEQNRVVQSILAVDAKTHSHSNKSILDKIGSDENGLYWED